MWVHARIARRPLCLLLAGVATGIALHAAPPRSDQQKPQPPEPEAEGVLSILWSDARRLAWADFVAKPQLRTGASAMTAYVLSYGDQCADGVYSHSVVAAFLPDKSWVRAEVLFKGSRLALQHEQTHFDLGEVHARKIRRALDALPKPCEMTDAQRDKVVFKFLQEDRDRQAIYDAQTSFGSDGRRQLEWDMRVSGELNDLKAFARASGDGAGS